MGTAHTRSPTPDLFSLGSAQEQSPPSANQRSTPPATTSTAVFATRYILPNDLPNAIKQLEDTELDRLLSAVLAEQKRRGRSLPQAQESLLKRRVEVAPSTLTRGQINAVQSAFKAGVSPSRIAREFGVSKADVRKALAGETSKS